MGGDGLRVAFRRLKSEAAYSLVVIGGLALGLSTIILFFSYLSAILSIDSDVPIASQVIRLEQKTHTPGADQNWIPNSPMVFHDHWASAGVPAAVSVRYYDIEMSIREGARIQLEKIGFTDPEIGKLFGLKALYGDIATALARPDAVVLTARAARKYFGTEMAIGKILRISGSPQTVLAVIEDREPSSVVDANVLANIKSPLMPEPFRLTSWFSIRGQNYVRLMQGATPEQVAELANTYFLDTPAVKELPPAYGRIATFRAVALPDIPLHGAGSGSARQLVFALAAASFVVLVLAGINYVNLNVVRMLSRQREIGIRKAVGASPRQVALQFLLEGLAVVALAFVIGVAFAWIEAFAFRDELGWAANSLVFAPKPLAAAACVALLLGIVVSSYPAAIAYRVRPAYVLVGRGDAESPSGLWLRRTLTVFQVGAAVVFLSVTLTVLFQTAHAINASPGYDASSILALDAPADMRDERLLAFREAAERIPGVQSVGLSWDVPGRFKRNTTADLTGVKGESVLLAYSLVGPGFFQAYGIRPIAGRVYDVQLDRQGNNSVLIVDSKAAQQLGFARPDLAIGQRVQAGQQSSEIIGVVNPIRLRSLRQSAAGTVFGIGSREGVSVVSIRARDKRLLPMIESTWRSFFPDDVMRAEWVDVQLARQYEGDLRLAKLVGGGGALSIVLAAFGLYVLAAYTVTRRTLEIVVRKIYGAGPLDVLFLLSRELLLSLGFAAALGVPLGAALSFGYTTGFVDRTSSVPVAICAAVFVIVVVAVIATGRHAVSAMRLMPAQVLRR